MASGRGTVNVDSNSKVAVKSEVKTRFYGFGSGVIANSTTKVSTGLGNAKLAETVLGPGSSINGFQVNIGVTVDFGNKPVSVAGPITANDAGVIAIRNVAALRDDNDNGRDISAGSRLIQGRTGDVRAAANPLETSLSKIEIATTGGIFLDNDRALTIGEVDGLVGLNAGGAINVMTKMLKQSTSSMFPIGLRAGSWTPNRRHNPFLCSSGQL